MIHLERARAGDDRASGQACFLDDTPAGIVVLTTGPDGISGITRFLLAHEVLNRT